MWCLAHKFSPRPVKGIVTAKIFISNMDEQDKRDKIKINNLI
jgi:hypothetical protein